MEYRRAVYDALSKAEQKVASLSQDVIKAEQRTRLQRLTAPVDGVVQQLAVHTVGGVVTPAQVLAVVVPTQAPLEIEAMVSNRDSDSFMPVRRRKSRSIPSTSPLRAASWRSAQPVVGCDHPRQAIERVERPQRGRGGELQRTGGQQLEYAARISLDRTDMQVGEKLVKLSPGMAVTVEVKTGSRRIISYLLSPLAKYKRDALRER